MFWEFNDRKLSEFTVMDGDPILTYFQQHAARMEDKTPMNSLYTKNTVVDKDNPIDVLLSYEMQSGTVTGLQLDDTTLTAGTDYEQTEDTITVSASVFSDVATGEHTIQLLTSEGNQPKVKIRVYSAAEEAQKRSVIDDFESYGEDTAPAAAYTTNVNGDTLKISLDAEHTKNGSYAMKYDYSVADGGAGYCGATKKLSNANWTGFDGVRFWILSDGSNRETTFQFVDGAGAYWESIQKVTAEETGWQEVKIPFSDFHVQQWGALLQKPQLCRAFQSSRFIPDRTAIRVPAFGILMILACIRQEVPQPQRLLRLGQPRRQRPQQLPQKPQRCRYRHQLW